MEKIEVRKKWENIVNEIENDTQNREELKETFTYLLSSYCSLLELDENSDNSEIFQCYEIALRYYPKDSNILVELGAFFAKFNKDEEAKEIFKQALENDKRNLRAYQNLQNLKLKIARWHFRMLNDNYRNESYQSAIRYWIEKGKKEDVIDIGTGTGLLSIYAAQSSNVKNIYSIESDKTMCDIATNVFKENENQLCKLPELINKNSLEVEIGKDIPSKASLVFSEILDSAAFGEGILEAFIHAKENLLQADGKIIPYKVKIIVAGYNSKELCSSYIILNETLNEYIFLDNYRLIADTNEPYDAEYVDKIKDFRLVTKPCETLEINFNSIKSLNQHFDGIIMKNFQLQSDVSNDYLDGFIVWFDLYLNEMDLKNVISTKPENSGTCWNQAIFKLRERVLLQKYEIIKLSISCRDGILKIDHSLDEHLSTKDIRVDPYVIKFLNDEDYLDNLEYAANEYKKSVKNCLDLSPFPYIGFLMLKESKIDKLWCSKDNEELLRILAVNNCIDERHFVFVEDLSSYLDARFELIVLNPFNELGDLNNQICNNYSIYKGLLSSDDSLLIPYKVSIFGELINSEWLLSCCKVVNPKILDLKIDKYINDYATEIHLDIDHFYDYEKLTDEFRIAVISMDDDYHEKIVKPLMLLRTLPCHAILLFFKIQFTMRTTREFSTYRRDKLCSFRKFAHILPKEKYNYNSHAKVRFIQNYGLLKIDCE